MGFFSSFFGGDQRKDLQRAKKKSDAALQSGYDEAQPFYDEAFDQFTPYAEQGQQANRLYGQAIGLGTDEERTAAQDRYFSDPAQSAILDQGSNRLLKQLNARGQTYGGTSALAGARAGLENYNSWLDRLNTQGGAGFGAASSQAGIRSGQGDLRYGLGATQAGQETSFGNAMAESRNTGINNLLSLAGTAAKAYAASDIRFKRDIEAIGALPSGLPVYSFRYTWSDEPHIGVMAHEAEQVFPEAVARNDDGYGFVNYAMIG